MKTINKNIIEFQVRGIVIYEYLKIFHIFEKEIKRIFEKNIKNLKTEHLNKLYFLYGGKIGPHVDIEQETVKLNPSRYKRDEDFKEFTAIQIIKLSKGFKEIEEFNFQVNSLQSSKIFYDFYDIAIKLINMRNVIAHQSSNIKFEQGKIIEVLSDNKIVENYDLKLLNFDISSMDEISKQIYSNMIYMKIAIKNLNSDINLEEE